MIGNDQISLGKSDRRPVAQQAVGFAVLLFLCLAVGGLGGLVTASSVSTWYPTLHKPTWNPPAAVFGPVWTALYVMMAVAGWLVWRQTKRLPTRAMLLFGLQLVLNLAWSGLFFGLRQPGLALVEIVLLLAVIVATSLAFSRHSRAASILFVPYILWVGYATSLNAAIWYLNR